MQIINITKSIPVHTVWIHDQEDKRQVKACTYDIEFSLRTQATEESTKKQLYLQQNISFSTISTFLYDQLHHSLIYNMASKNTVERAFASHDNNFMILPELSETCFTMALHSKLNHICHENSYVESLTIKDKVENLTYNFFADDLEYEDLPDIKEWLGELSFWDTPWWRRKDFSTFDNVAENKEEHEVFFSDDANQGILERMSEPLREIEHRVIADIYGDEIREIISEEEKEKGKLVEVDFKNKTFKPKLVPKDK
tara:strand:+ start:373 stop:1137 length:765 start_codon:yes stop_codon:yes gene_type:complete